MTNQFQNSRTYEFDELSPRAKDHIRDWFRRTELNLDVAMSMSDDAVDDAIRAKGDVYTEGAEETRRPTSEPQKPTIDKSRTLAELIAETSPDDADPAFVYCTADNEAGQLMEYDAETDAMYGNIVLFPTLPHMSADHVECVYASDWFYGSNGYRFQIRF